MTVVLVHGNPETDAVWGPLVDGLGHWWMVEDPAVGAAALIRFWESLDG